MSYIRNVINKHICEYNKAKTGKWTKPECPPENTFSKSELYAIGRAIADEIEGKLCDDILMPYLSIKWEAK
jgi:hypothetical protein